MKIRVSNTGITLTIKIVEGAKGGDRFDVDFSHRSGSLILTKSDKGHHKVHANTMCITTVSPEDMPLHGRMELTSDALIFKYPDELPPHQTREAPFLRGVRGDVTPTTLDDVRKAKELINSFVKSNDNIVMEVKDNQLSIVVEI